MRYVDAEQVRQELVSGAEIAFIDVREYGQYGEGHPFFATNIPYSTLEIQAPALLPCHHCHCVLFDQGDGIAEKASRRLAAIGYDNLSVLEGGANGWAKSGFNLFKGVNLPSKTFGEIIEHKLGTPSISADELSRMQQTDSPPIVFDGRTPAEFQKMNIPGALSLPNAEIAHRLDSFIDNEDQTIVVNCAGRTRSILGTQTLRQLNIKNPVIALRNGTAGWSLAGLKLQHGTRPASLPTPTAQMQQRSTQMAREYRQRHQIPTISMDQCEVLSADTARSSYFLDVRTIEEYNEGHLKGSRHAAGGQLVQATDQWVAVRGAKIVLIDDTGLRASTTAGWLRAMGHCAVVLDADVSQLPQLIKDEADEQAIALTANPALAQAEVTDIAQMLAQGSTLIDLSSGMDFRAGHIKGAHWCVRPRLAPLLSQLAPAAQQPLILSGADQAVRRLAAIDARELGYENLLELDANLSDCERSGLDIVATPEQPSDTDCIDYLFFVHDRHDGNLEASRQYLEWETGLLQQVDEQELSVFQTS